MPKIVVKDYWEVHALPNSIEIEVTERQLAELQDPMTKDDALRTLVLSHGHGQCVGYSHVDEGNFEVL